MPKIRKDGEVMTRNQKKFADEYIIDCNATRAYKAAYPNVKNDDTARKLGSRMMTNDDIKSYIDEQLKKLHTEKTADAQEVLEYLTSVMRGEHKEETLCLVGDGCQKIKKIDVSAKERLKAAELLGKRYGIFTEKLDLNADMDLNISVDYGDENEHKDTG